MHIENFFLKKVMHLLLKKQKILFSCLLLLVINTSYSQLNFRFNVIDSYARNSKKSGEKWTQINTVNTKNVSIDFERGKVILHTIKGDLKYEIFNVEILNSFDFLGYSVTKVFIKPENIDEGLYSLLYIVKKEEITGIVHEIYFHPENKDFILKFIGSIESSL